MPGPKKMDADKLALAVRLYDLQRGATAKYIVESRSLNDLTSVEFLLLPVVMLIRLAKAQLAIRREIRTMRVNAAIFGAAEWMIALLEYDLEHYGKSVGVAAFVEGQVNEQLTSKGE